MVETSADLATATPRVQPMRAGEYFFGSGNNAVQVSFSIAEDGRYTLVPHEPQDGVEAFPAVSFFGPVNGLYLVQLQEVDQQTKQPVANSFQVVVVRIDDATSLLVGETTISGWVAEALFDGLDLPMPANATVGTLTDNAHLNWAVLQRVLVLHGGEMEFMPYMVPFE